MIDQEIPHRMTLVTDIVEGLSQRLSHIWPDPNFQVTELVH